MFVSKLLISIIDTLYFKPLERVISRHTFGYLLCGCANMVLDALWYFVIYHFVVDQQNINLGFVVISPHIAALIIVFPITFLTGFYLNRYVVFRAIDQRKRKQIFRYGISVVGSILLNYALLKIFVEACGIWPTIAKVMTTIIVAMYSYIAARYFSFNTHYER